VPQLWARIYAADGSGVSHTYSASSTSDFASRGDLLLGLIDDQQSGFAGGAGFRSMQLTIEANGAEILDTTFRSLAIAKSFFPGETMPFWRKRLCCVVILSNRSLGYGK
jgi:hypothetical protein